MNVLLVEDEFEVASFIKRGLEEQQYAVTLARDGRTGLSMALSQEFDIIILDLMLPGINGLEICNTLRASKNLTPILILTAMGSVSDKVKGLESGADDYITKPFHFDELLARIKVLVRRSKNVTPDKIYTAADLILNCYTRTVTRNNEGVYLTVKEFTLLEVLMANKNRILSRKDIAAAVWGEHFDKDSNLIDVYINFLRNKVDKGFDKKLIQTVIGMGYIIRD
jgi:two-component system copper resistance phosphate regulon response regulator CusR